MSQKTVDLNTTILTSSLLTAVLGGTTTSILWASGQADPTVIAWICAGAISIPAAISLPVLALKSLIKNTKEAAQAAPPQINQYYTGPVHQNQHTHLHTNNRGIVATTRNQLPPAY